MGNGITKPFGEDDSQFQSYRLHVSQIIERKNTEINKLKHQVESLQANVDSKDKTKVNKQETTVQSTKPRKLFIVLY